MSERKVILYFDFEEQKILIEEKWARENGVPIAIWHHRAAQRTLADSAEITNQEEADKLISNEQRAEFVQLCEKYYTQKWDGSNMRGYWFETPLDDFVSKLSQELEEEIDYAKQNMQGPAGIAFVSSAIYYCSTEHYKEEGLTALSTDAQCERIAQKITEEALHHNNWILNDTEEIVFDARQEMREEMEEKIKYVLVCGAEREEYYDLHEAFCSARFLAHEIALNNEIDVFTLDEWGDDMQTGWGVCPEGDSGAYWPQIHCELDGKRIDNLPWEERGTK